ncbi:MAG: 4-hydroxy-tetrahydrodipicolinate reductase [Rhodospirillales bacterium]|nr:4-hydroxy-tetrahydrodipicolinate reductase [Rhodospirillales bacterium]
MKIGIVGCGGRMGRMLVQAVHQTPGAELAGGSESKQSEFLGQDPALLAGLKASGLKITDDSRALFEASDCVVDFTVPAATEMHAKLALETGTALVPGTTGLSADQQAVIVKASKSVAIVQAANYSIGVNLLLGLTEQVAGVLGEEFDIEVLEMHHRHKIDAPSGTALALGKAAAAGRGVNLDEVSDRVRDGHTGARTVGNIGFATLRGGMVVGDHTVIFASDDERIEITHRAADRGLFAKGAIRAAMWTAGKAPGLYSMRDVLGFD